MKKKGNTTLAILGVVAVLVVLVVAGVISIPAGMLSTASDADDSIDVQCDSTTTPSVNFKSYDAENVGTAVTELLMYRIHGEKTWSTGTAGTGFAASPGQKLEVIYGISTTDFTDNAYGQYIAEYQVPCDETPAEEYAVYNDEIETSLSATFFNADGTAAAETFTTGQTQTVSAKLLAGTDEVFGNPFIADSGLPTLTGQRASYPNVGCLDLNATSWDQPVEVSFDGTKMRKVSTPQRHTTPSGDNTYCYEMPVIDDTLMENNKYLMRLNADDTTAPADDGTLSIYAANIFYNTDDGNLYWGIENEEGTAVGTDAADTLTLDFT